MEHIIEELGEWQGIDPQTGFQLVLIYFDRRFPIPNTLPGELVDIVVEFQAPYAAMNTRATWKMIDSRGNLCFPDQYNCGLLVEIMVIELEQT